MFARKGLIEVEKDTAPDEDRLLELALEAGAEDLNDSESSWEIISDAGTVKAVSQAARSRRAFRSRPPRSRCCRRRRSPWTGERHGRCWGLIESLEDLDDVQAVYANFDISEEIMASL